MVPRDVPPALWRLRFSPESWLEKQVSLSSALASVAVLEVCGSEKEPPCGILGTEVFRERFLALV